MGPYKVDICVGRREGKPKQSKQHVYMRELCVCIYMRIRLLTYQGTDQVSKYIRIMGANFYHQRRESH